MKHYGLCSITFSYLNSRKFVGGFVLSGEGPVIDRIMENFGARYFKDNPGTTFVDAGYCF